MKKVFRGVLVACCVVLGATAQAGEVTVAVAANFSAPAQKLVTAFATATGHQAKLVVGSTGKPRLLPERFKVF